jgi:hypothetical protein
VAEERSSRSPTSTPVGDRYARRVQQGPYRLLVPVSSAVTDTGGVVSGEPHATRVGLGPKLGWLVHRRSQPAWTRRVDGTAVSRWVRESRRTSTTRGPRCGRRDCRTGLIAGPRPPRRRARRRTALRAPTPEPISNATTSSVRPCPSRRTPGRPTASTPYSTCWPRRRSRTGSTPTDRARCSTSSRARHGSTSTGATGRSARARPATSPATRSAASPTRVELCRAIAVMTPGGAEEFFGEVGRASDDRSLPEPLEPTGGAPVAVRDRWPTRLRVPRLAPRTTD